MYCASCGVKLSDTEKKCPLCGLKAYHPEIRRPEAESNYPAHLYPEQEVSPWGIKVLVLTVFLLPLITVILCDIPIHGKVTWSGYVIGALILLGRVIIAIMVVFLFFGMACSVLSHF